MTTLIFVVVLLALTVAGFLLAAALAALLFVLLEADYYLAPAGARAAHPDHEWLRPGRGLGLGFGIAATALIALNLAYLLRRSPRMRTKGPTDPTAHPTVCGTSDCAAAARPASRWCRCPSPTIAWTPTAGPFALPLGERGEAWHARRRRCPTAVSRRVALQWRLGRSTLAVCRAMFRWSSERRAALATRSPALCTRQA